MDALSYVLVVVLAGVVIWLANRLRVLKKENAQLSASLATAQAALPPEGTEQSLQGITFDLLWVCRTCGWFGRNNVLYKHVRRAHGVAGPPEAA